MTVTLKEGRTGGATTEGGIALVIVLLAMTLLSSLGAGLLLLSDTERLLATNDRVGRELLYATEAAAERAIQDLWTSPHWTDVLTGAVTSSFAAGSLTPTLASRRVIDLTAMTAAVQAASDAVAPWMLDNPVWRLFAYGPVSSLIVAGGIPSAAYLVVWVADDPSEADGDPLVDTNGVVTLLARALGDRNAVRSLEVTVMKVNNAGSAGVRILSWRDIQ